MPTKTRFLTILALLISGQTSALELTSKFYGEVNVAYDSVSPGDSDFQS